MRWIFFSDLPVPPSCASCPASCLAASCRLRWFCSADSRACLTRVASGSGQQLVGHWPARFHHLLVALTAFPPARGPQRACPCMCFTERLPMQLLRAAGPGPHGPIGVGRTRGPARANPLPRPAVPAVHAPLPRGWAGVQGGGCGAMCDGVCAPCMVFGMAGGGRSWLVRPDGWLTMRRLLLPLRSGAQRQVDARHYAQLAAARAADHHGGMTSAI